jgi:cytochrome c oxidase assembly factor CtaG
MTPEVKALLLDWEIPLWTTVALVLTAAIYLRGWILIRKTRPASFPVWRLVCFLGGIFSLFVATASPLDTLDEKLLSAHMGQHFLFMSVAPPLLLLSAPAVPLLRGLPRIVIRLIFGPILRLLWLRKLGRFLSGLKPAWLAMNIVYIGWHVPEAYELALRSENWHNVEHACFFFTSLLFWLPILRHWPGPRPTLGWMLLPYLLTSDIVNTGLSAFLCFAGRPIYSSYIREINPLGLTPLYDQVAAGAFMWVFGSIVFLIPAIFITLQILSCPNTHSNITVERPSIHTAE